MSRNPTLLHGPAPQRLGPLGFAPLALSCLIFSPAVAGGPSGVQILQKGYRVTLHDECGTFGVKVPPKSPLQVPRLPIEDIECSPGGSWGDYAYLVLTPDPAAGLYVDVERVRFNGQSEWFANVDWDWYGGYLSFAPPGWRGGEVLFATTSSHVRWILPSGSWDPGQVPPVGEVLNPGPMAADPGGDFGGDLFYATDGEIHRVDAAGNSTFFVLPPLVGPEMRFGPGGPWGTNLYTGGSVIAPDGTVTPFPALFGEFDWAFGPGFNGDMFELHGGDLDRIQPDGTRTLFGTAAASQVAFCNGALWLAGTKGCYTVTPKGSHKK